MRKLSMFVLLAVMSALTVSGGAQADYASDYNFDAKLATNKTIPVEIEKTKIDEPTLSLVMSASVLKAYGKCDNQIKMIPGEAKVDREARQAREAAEAQAQAAAEEAAKAKNRVKVLPLAGPVTGDVWYLLRMCESGNTYNRNSGNHYYGAYQYDIGTWGNYMGYARADLAPPEVQDAKARETQAARGWSPWPACSRKLGLR